MQNRVVYVCSRLGLLLVACAMLVPWQAMAVGTWTPLAHTAPNTVGTMLLLSDGTVMGVNVLGSAWYRLTPDAHGSYVNGTWSTLTPMHDTRLYFASQVLRDGRVFVAGGEYGTGGSLGETYDPLMNSWTTAPAPGHKISDGNSETLPDGRVLVALVEGSLENTVIFDPVSNTWSNGPTCNGVHNESMWVKLPDASILFVDRLSTNSERYISAQNQWIVDATLPVALYDPFGDESGAGFLLPNGQAFFLGSTGHTALYTPTGNTSPGVWTAGPDIPNGQGTPDAAAAMMANGKILCAVSPVPTSGTHFPTPTSFYEYDPVANSFTLASAPTGATENNPSYYTTMLDLPDGTVLFSHFSSQLYIYQPDGSPLAAGKPTITGLIANADGSYHLAGTQFNGISEGAAYGDDVQMNSNYPIVRMTDAAGNVYYARTYNWSSTSVMTGTNLVTTEFMPPSGLPAGAYSLLVVANGISSDPVSFFTPYLLQVTLSDDASQALLTWPLSASNAVLETTTDLVSNNWVAVTDTVSVVGSTFILTNSASVDHAFFRLHGH